MVLVDITTDDAIDIIDNYLVRRIIIKSQLYSLNSFMMDYNETIMCKSVFRNYEHILEKNDRIIKLFTTALDEQEDTYK